MSSIRCALARTFRIRAFYTEKGFLSFLIALKSSEGGFSIIIY